MAAQDGPGEHYSERYRAKRFGQGTQVIKGLAKKKPKPPAQVQAAKPKVKPLAGTKKKFTGMAPARPKGVVVPGGRMEGRNQDLVAGGRMEGRNQGPAMSPDQAAAARRGLRPATQQVAAQPQTSVPQIATEDYRTKNAKLIGAALRPPGGSPTQMLPAPTQAESDRAFNNLVRMGLRRKKQTQTAQP